MFRKRNLLAFRYGYRMPQVGLLGRLRDWNAEARAVPQLRARGKMAASFGSGTIVVDKAEKEVPGMRMHMDPTPGSSPVQESKPHTVFGKRRSPAAARLLQGSEGSSLPAKASSWALSSLPRAPCLALLAGGPSDDKRTDRSLAQATKRYFYVTVCLLVAVPVEWASPAKRRNRHLS